MDDAWEMNYAIPGTTVGAGPVIRLVKSGQGRGEYVLSQSGIISNYPSICNYLIISNY